MQRSREEQLEDLRSAALNALSKITRQDVNSMMSYSHPPPLALKTLQCCLWLLAGVYDAITVRTEDKDPTTEDWYACRIMVFKDVYVFIDHLKEYFKHIHEPFVSRHVEIVKKRWVQQQDFTFQRIDQSSNVCGQLSLWVSNVVRYWDLMKPE